MDVRNSNCQLCGYFCGVKVTVKEGNAVKIAPDPERYPYDSSVMAGCRRFAANREILEHPDRINFPLKRDGARGAGKWRRISWDQALGEITERLGELESDYGPESLATCISAPHTVYWPMHRFLNLWGSPNNIGMGIVCWNPRIWVGALTYGWPLEDELVPGLTECAILWGINPAESDCSLFWKHLKEFTRQGGDLVVIDPRRTETARLTDKWLSPRPGSDGALALGMLHVILGEGLYDEQFVARHCTGFERLAERVKEYPPERVAALTGIVEERVRETARLYARSKPASIFTGLGIDQSGFNCTQTLRAIASLRAVTGNVDRPGASLLNEWPDFVSEVELELTDALPQAQREKKLGCGLFPLQRYEGYEKMLELTRLHGKQLSARYMTSAHPHLAWEAMLTGQPYPIRALICMASNPLLCQADSRRVHRALKGLDLLVVLEKFMTPTAMLADYVLPIAGGIERSVVQMNGGVAKIVYGGPPALAPLFDRRTDFHFWRELGVRCGQERFWPWKTEEEAMDHVLKPTGQTWEAFAQNGLHAPEPTYFKYTTQGFATPSEKVELYSALLAEAGHDPLPSYHDPGSADGDLLLITGVRKQPYYSSEFRQIESLRRRHPFPSAELSPETANSLGLQAGDQVWIETPTGRIKHRLVLADMHPGTVSVELGWWFPEKPAREPELGGMWESNANVLTSADVASCDPILGQWSFRGVPCKVYRALDLEQCIIRRGSSEDKEEVLALLLEEGMDCSNVPIEEFMLLIDRERIVACVRLEEHRDFLMIRPIVVAKNFRGQGAGSFLLAKGLPPEREVVLVARGTSVSFYGGLGFSDMNWESVPRHQYDECDQCPDRKGCKPLPMIRPKV
jgi:anaerobic selenocysteine-containing dehydrogenase/N-acetylglutamate synthase-like GNAT family acetyltransferase